MPKEPKPLSLKSNKQGTALDSVETPLFMGMANLLAKRLANNDSGFFIKFTKCRKQLEDALVTHKPLIGAIVQQTHSGKRYATVATLFDYLIESFATGKNPTEQEMVEKVGVAGKIIVGTEYGAAHHFSDDTKSAVFLSQALRTALRCPICGGYLDPNKSVSYDHKEPLREGGTGQDENCQLTHPFCNNARDALIQSDPIH
jgi:hypothetical protein